MNRHQVADLIHARLSAERDRLADACAAATHRIGHFVVDYSMPADLARGIAQAIPAKETRSPGATFASARRS